MLPWSSRKAVDHTRDIAKASKRGQLANTFVRTFFARQSIIRKITTTSLQEGQTITDVELLRRAISDMITISESEAETFMSSCYRRSFKKKEILSEDHKIIDEVYFIEKGIIRVKIFDLNGTEHTIHFAIENQFIADYRAFLTKEKSRYQLEAMEATNVIVLPRQSIEWGYENLREGQKLGRLIAEFYFTYLDQRIEHLYTLSPMERYELMNQIFPNIHNRVPQHMIASYLGITPIHLSRIKRESIKT